MDITQQVIWAKVEGTYKVDPTPVQTDAVLVENFQFSRDNLKMIDRNPIEASKGTRQKIYAGSLYSLTFDVEVKGSGAAGTAPEIGALFQGAGMLETVVASTSVAYTPASTGQKSITIYRYIDGKRQIFSGLRGSWELKVTVHDKLMASFTFVGHLITEADAAIGSATYDTTVPVPIVGASFIVDSYSAVVNSLTIGMNSEIKIPTDMNAANGFGEVNLGKRNVSGAFDPEEVLNATYNFRDKFETQATAVLSVGSIGAVAGNIFDVTMPAISYVGDNGGERENKVTKEMQYEAHQTTGDNDVTITLT